ncbi:MAG: coenzyme F420-0:L-glutamate ligase [Candidatus Pacebacteria bacterium]|nr:coenzyme F420-0:L-glutamate ligase [Candidatus Paceibacterota bacterium]
MALNPNPEKSLIIEVGGKKYARYPVKTHLILQNENIFEVVDDYTRDHLKLGDIVFISEKCVAASQGRTYPQKEVRPGRLARFLVRFVTKSPYGIGLGSPETMQLAVEEAGALRIIFAAFVAAITKPFGIKGMFYRVAGPQAKAIDGAVPYAIPPYNTHVTKAPLRPNETAQEISNTIGAPVAIVDACDLGAWIVGKSRGLDEKLVLKALKDNPLGQTSQQTPIGIIREVKE